MPSNDTGNVMLFPIVGILALNDIPLVAQHVVFEQSICRANFLSRVLHSDHIASLGGIITQNQFSAGNT
jgi:hypothetical protein